MYLLKVIAGLLITAIGLVCLLFAYFGIIVIMYLIIILGAIIQLLIPVIIIGGGIYLGWKGIVYLYKRYLQNK